MRADVSLACQAAWRIDLAVQQVPFKLTREFVDVLGGHDAPLYTDTFVELCTAALRSVRQLADTLLPLIEITAYKSRLPCFDGAGNAPLAAVRERLMLDVPDVQLRARVQQLIGASYNSVLTRAYDEFQRWSNGIL